MIQMIQTINRTARAATAAILTVTFGTITLGVCGGVAAAPPTGTAAPAGDRELPKNEFPREWFWGNDAQRARHDAMIGIRPPALAISRWIGEAQTLSELRGKVVVVDFWATWCGPCMRAMPMHKQLLETHADDGFVFIAIHDHARGLERLDGVIEQQKLTYPIGVDDAGKSARSWNLAFWPTYGVIDREGRVRAVGLRPDRVPEVVKKLVAEPVPADLRPKRETPPARGADQPPSGGSASLAFDESMLALASPLPIEWTERMPETRAELERLLGQPAPPLPRGEWMNSRPLRFEDLRGKVVLLDFWATWCAPCIKAIPDLNRFQERYAKDGLVVVGICHGRGAERMTEIAQRHRIGYPIVSDPELAAVKAYRVDTYPDYYLIDRAGRVRGVDLRWEKLELAIERLLAE